MTGYGRGVTSGAAFCVTVELRSVNGKNLDVHLRLPSYYNPVEAEMKSRVSGRVARGKIALSVSVETFDPLRSQNKVRINQELIAAYYAQLDSARQALGLQSEIPLATILALPDVIIETHPEIDPDEWEQAAQALEQALVELIAARRREGALLLIELEQRINAFKNALAEITPHEKRREENLRARLEQSLQEFSHTFAVSEDRFGQELILYLERWDIREEKVRIQAHVEHFENVLQNEERQGRKLGFILQEMWREVNTLGVKANDADIQAAVVTMKDEIEKMKEQLMNVV